MDFGWNESAFRVDPRCGLGGTKVKHRWNFSEIKVKIRWGYKCKQYFFSKIVVNNQTW
jgi:hypothetical protein